MKHCIQIAVDMAAPAAVPIILPMNEVTLQEERNQRLRNKKKKKLQRHK